MRSPSIRARVTGVASVAVALVLGVTGIVTVARLQHQLIDDLDGAAATIAADLVRAMGSGPPPNVLVAAGDDDTWAQLVDGAGRVQSSTTNVAGEEAVVAIPGLSTRRGLPHDAARFRVLARPVDGGLLIVGVTLDDVDDSVDALRLTLLLISPIVLLVLAALVWLVVGRTLRPVELAHQRQRRFVADASHELRSPLTRIRAELEVDLAHPDGVDPWATHRTVLADAIALQALVDDLLLLARTDAGQVQPPRTVVDLDDLVLAELRAQGREGVALDVSRVSGGQVLGRAEELRRVVRNLLDNAVRHATTTVTIELREVDEETVLSVADDGPGIPPDQRARVFERFARLDDARAAHGGGTGLGLAITRDIVEAHGGSVVVDPDGGPGTRMVVRLPRAV